MPQEEKMRRLHAVEALQERIATGINETYLGSTQEVLVEGEKDATFTGRSRTNKLVHFTADAAPAIGDLVDVLVTKTTPWSLQGELAKAPAAVA